MNCLIKKFPESAFTPREQSFRRDLSVYFSSVWQQMVIWVIYILA